MITKEDILRKAKGRQEETDQSLPCVLECFERGANSALRHLIHRGETTNSLKNGFDVAIPVSGFNSLPDFDCSYGHGISAEANIKIVGYYVDQFWEDIRNMFLRAGFEVLDEFVALNWQLVKRYYLYYFAHPKVKFLYPLFVIRLRAI